MAIICPTVTPDSVEKYSEEVVRLVAFAPRIHLDFMDGVFAPSLSPALSEISMPVGISVDLHLMYRQPSDYVQEIISHKPSLVIVHAEVNDNIEELITRLHSVSIKVGVALLQDTAVTTLQPIANVLDHVLIFSGNLGYQGGSKVDFDLLEKVSQIKQLNSAIEIGWDGGVNDQNIKQLAEAGIDVINVGGFIQKAEDPKMAYQKLVDALV